MKSPAKQCQTNEVAPESYKTCINSCVELTIVVRLIDWLFIISTAFNCYQQIQTGTE